jgi:hypothetical protein
MTCNFSSRSISSIFTKTRKYVVGPSIYFRGVFIVDKLTRSAIRIVLPPCRIIGQLRILRQTLTFNFSQEIIRYII